MKILVYHGIVKKLDNFDKFFQKHILIKNFEERINIIKKKHKVLSLEEFDYKWQKRELKDNEILIFFDDCYKSATSGAEILENLKMPAVFAISSDLVNRGYSWIDDIEKVLINTKKKTIKFNNSFFDISTETKKFNVILNLKKYFQSISADVIIKKLENLIRACEINPREIIQEKFEIISWDQIEQIKSINSFSVVHHGHLHYLMSCFNQNEGMADIKKNIEILRIRMSISPRFFVYPFGRGKRDYTDRLKRDLKELGFKFAFSTEKEKVDYSDPFAIPRVNSY